MKYLLFLVAFLVSLCGCKTSIHTERRERESWSIDTSYSAKTNSYDALGVFKARLDTISINDRIKITLYDTSTPGNPVIAVMEGEKSLSRYINEDTSIISYSGAEHKEDEQINSNGQTEMQKESKIDAQGGFAVDIFIFLAVLTLILSTIKLWQKR